MRFTALILTAVLLAAAQSAAAQSASGGPLTPLAVLNQKAQAQTAVQPYLALAPEQADIFNGLDALEPGRVPNYLRALAALPKTVQPFAQLIKTFGYGGTVAPEIKLAMGVHVAQVYGSVYPAVHWQRLLRATPRGQQLLAALQANEFKPLTAAEQAALRYARLLTCDIHGVSETEFARTRAAFNDAQIVELTMAVAFFNYFTRLCEGLNLPLEPWALAQPVAAVNAAKFQAPPARVALVSDDEMNAVSEALAAKEASKEPGKEPGRATANSLGLGVANSQRAFLRVPALYRAWRAYGNAAREYAQVSRIIKLHVSFAVSMANGCRYCTLHQVLGLRRQGVDAAKLVALKKDDAQLTPTELTAVRFARKLTTQPTALTAADFAALQTEFGASGAFEVLLQTCNFAFMNRFTDGLRLPSEDEALRVYHEVYGANWP